MFGVAEEACLDCSAKLTKNISVLLIDCPFIVPCRLAHVSHSETQESSKRREEKRKKQRLSRERKQGNSEDRSIGEVKEQTVSESPEIWRSL